MAAPISVIIPTLEAEHSLPHCLYSLMEGVQAGLINEVVIVDGGSKDGTAQLAQEWGANILLSTPSRGAQLRAGAAASRGKYLLFLHADTRLEAGWSDVVVHALDQGPAVFRLAFLADHPMAVITAGWANLRTRTMGLPYGDQGLLMSRADYDGVGGFEDIPLMEDVAMARRLRNVTLLNAKAFTSADKYTRDGWVWRGARNLWILVRYFAGVAPENLAKKY